MNGKVVVVGAGPGYGAPYVGCYSHLEQRLLVNVRPRGKSMLLDTLRKAGWDIQEFVQRQVMDTFMVFDEADTKCMPTETTRKPKPYYNKSRW